MVVDGGHAGVFQVLKKVNRNSVNDSDLTSLY